MQYSRLRKDEYTITSDSGKPLRYLQLTSKATYATESNRGKKILSKATRQHILRYDKVYLEAHASDAR